MMKRNWLIYTAMIGIFFLYTAHSGGPLAGKTGAPGENTCSQCHSGGNPQGLDGTISVGGVPATIIGGNTYTISVLVTNPNALSQGGGFQMTALDENNMKAGNFSSPSSGSQLKTGMGRQYHNHTSRRAFSMGQATWTVNWTAPTSVNNEDITFYAAGNITDMQPGFNTANDLIVTSTAVGTLQGMGAPLVVEIIQSSDVSCFSGDDGSARAMASGGAGGYTFMWSNGDSGPDIFDLEAGTYTVSVTDMNSNMATNQVSIMEPPTPTSIAVVFKKDITCFDGNNGQIDVNATGNNGGFTYRWSNGQNGASIRNLKAGSYTVVARDFKGCEESLTIDLVEPDEIDIAIQTADAKCSDDSTGYAKLTASGGTSPYTFTWPDGFTNEGLSSERTILPAGEYDIQIQDNQNCMKLISLEIKQENGVEVELVEQKNISCHEGADGRIDISINGGTMPYSIRWSNDSISEDVDQLTSGMYQVVVTDSLGCKDSLSVELFQPEPIALILIDTPLISCPGDSGLISYAFSGGTWGDQTSDTTSRVVEGGEVIISVVDSNGCMFSDTLELLIQDTIAPQILCIGDTMTFSCSFTYPEPTVSDNCDSVSWHVIEGPLPGDIFPSGTTIVKIRAVDEAGNSDTCEFMVQVEADLMLMATIIDSARCHGDSSIIVIHGEGGESELLVVIGTDTLPYVDSLTVATDTIIEIILFDSSGCFDVAHIGYHLEKIIIDSTRIKDASSINIRDGQVEIFVSGGRDPLNYTWFDSTGNVVGEMSIVDSLPPGIYRCVITDSLGCVVESSELVIDFSTSTKPIVANEVRLYPNPFRQSLFLEVDRVELQSVQVINSYGGIVYQNKICNASHELETNNWKAGIYYVIISTDSGQLVKKMIKTD